MAEVRLRETADAAFVSILAFSSSRYGRDAAEAYLLTFEIAFDQLRRHPRIGPLRTEIHPPIRCFAHRNHRIFYDIEDDDDVWVVRILHQAMDARRWLRSDAFG